jgi:alpha-D-xyloside xylohydrolase
VQRIVPLQRNGQTVALQQFKFNVNIPVAFSTAGYFFVFNMPGAGNVNIGEFGVGGALWKAAAALSLDMWVSTVPAGTDLQGTAPALYRQYADATGHAPLLREDAFIFWQSRNRYKSSAIAMSIAERYAQLELPVGVLVIDYHNQVQDGDFAPNPACYPSVAALAAGVRSTLNATLFMSFWPEVQASSPNYAPLKALGCLINADLGGLAIDSTIPACRDHIWSAFLKPRYYDQGVSAYWLDETDGEGTAGGDGAHGYDTSFGPAPAFTNLWVNSWLSMYSRPVALLGEVAPLLLTRGVWAGGQRFGVVLWSSDIWSSFEELASQVPQGVHASMSGIPWWTTDVGGYGCGSNQPNDSDYMRELIVRWYQFGLFCPVFRTHGCRDGPSEPDVAPCVGVAGSCGGNEIWSYNSNATQDTLASYILFRRDVLKPYIAALAKNVTVEGAPTMRPLWYEFPSDPSAYDVDDQYLLGPSLLVAPVVVQGATNRTVVFPAGATWVSVWDASVKVAGGVTIVVDAPLTVIPAYWRT